MDGPRILLIEDSHSLRVLACAFLSKHGYQVHAVGSLASARLVIGLFRPHAAVLDLCLEDGDGFDLLPELVERGVAVLVVSSRASTTDRITAFEQGVADYIVKPVDLRELLLRLRRCLQKGVLSPEPALRQAFGRSTIDVAERIVTSSTGRRIVLTASEFRLLQLFMCRGAEPVSKIEIARLVLLNEIAEDSRAVEMMVSKLRRKLTSLQEGHRLVNIRNVGYSLVSPADTSHDLTMGYAIDHRGSQSRVPAKT
jgi:two-component system OmpR family response regulator